MKRFIYTALLLLGISASANAELLTFDTHPDTRQGAYDDVGHYENYWFTSNLDWIDLHESNWDYKAHSGELAALNNNGGAVDMRYYNEQGQLDSFYFGGLWSKIFMPPASPGGHTNYANGSITGYINGDLVWTINAVISNAEYTYIPGNLQMVHKV